MRINDDVLYLTDNGACYCGAHLGNTARTTGHDLSGQPILPLTPDLVREAELDAGRPVPFACEHPKCGKTPSRLHVAR